GGRRAVRPRCGRHEGGHRLLRRRQRPLSRAAPAGRLDQLPDHRRRGGPGDQRHAQGARLAAPAPRDARRLPGRRADLRGAAGRHGQDRAARLAHRPPHRARRPGPRRLSRARRQSDPEAARHAPGAERAAGRRQRSFPALGAGHHLDRRWQPVEQPDPGGGARHLQCPLQRPPHRAQPRPAVARAPRCHGKRVPARDPCWRRSVPYHARPLHRSARGADRARGRGGAGAVDQRRDFRGALHQGRLPGGRVRAGRGDHSPGGRARSDRRPGSVDPRLPGPARQLRPTGLMPDRGEVLSGLFGAYRLAWFDPSGMAHFNLTVVGFWRSFFAAVWVAPAYAILVGMQLAAETEEFNLALVFLVEAIAYVLAWAAFPLAAVVLTRLLGLDRNYVALIVAVNWTAVLQTGAFLAVVLLALVLPQGLGTLVV